MHRLRLPLGGSVPQDAGRPTHSWMPDTVTDEKTELTTAWLVARERIAHRYVELLAAAGSPLLAAGATITAQLRSQLLAIVDDAAGMASPSPGDGTRLSASIGRDRAANGVHPSASLQAATLIFTAGLDDVAEHLRATGVEDALHRAALRLNEAILRRMADAASNYVGYLLEKAASAHRDEALRISRELHDTVGPEIAVGLQNLDLIEYWSERDPASARARIQAGRDQLHSAMGLVRALAAETRVAVEPGGLADALRRQLATLPRSTRTRFTSNDGLAGLAPHYGSQVFLVLREAVRNAARHADPTMVEVDIVVDGSTLTGSVADNGTGFDVSDATAGTGCSSMRERAALLGGELTIVSTARGTTVTLTVPLPAGVAHAP